MNFIIKFLFLILLIGGVEMHCGEINSDINYIDFALMRHGETSWNEKKLIVDKDGNEIQGPVIQGSTDIPLNINGLKQAQKAAEVVNRLGLNFVKLYTSPLERASKTAEILNQNLDLTIIEEPNIKACSWGDCEGKTKEYRSNTYGFDNFGNVRTIGWELLPTRERWKIQPIPNAESMNSVYERMASTFKKMAEESLPGDAILCTTHQENIKTFSLFCQADFIENLRLEGKLKEIATLETSGIKNCGFYHFRYDLLTQEFSYHGEILPK